MPLCRTTMAVFMTTARSSRRGMLHFVPPCDQEIGFDERSTMPPIKVSIPFWKCLRRAGSEFGVRGYHPYKSWLGWRKSQAGITEPVER